MLWRIVIIVSFLLMHQAVVGMSSDTYEDEFVAGYFKRACELLETAHDVKPEYLQKIDVQLGDECRDEDEKYSLLCGQCYLQVSNFLNAVIQNLNTSEFQGDVSIPQLCSSCAERLKGIRKAYKRFIDKKAVSSEIQVFEIIQSNQMTLSYNQRNVPYFFQKFLSKRLWLEFAKNKIWKPDYRSFYLLSPVIILGFYVAGLLAKKHKTPICRRFIAFAFLKYYPFKLLKTFINE